MAESVMHVDREVDSIEPSSSATPSSMVVPGDEHLVTKLRACRHCRWRYPGPRQRFEAFGQKHQGPGQERDRLLRRRARRGRSAEVVLVGLQPGLPDDIHGRAHDGPPVRFVAKTIGVSPGHVLCEASRQLPPGMSRRSSSTALTRGSRWRTDASPGAVGAMAEAVGM